VTEIKCEKDFAYHSGEVSERPTLEGGTQVICESCWKDYDQMVYEMWRSHAG